MDQGAFSFKELVLLEKQMKADASGLFEDTLAMGHLR